MTVTRLEGQDALDYARAVEGRTLCKYTDPIEGPRQGLTPDEADEVVREGGIDLIYAERVGAEDATKANHTKDNPYIESGEWAGFTIHEGRKNWQVIWWASYSGGMDGRRKTLPYSERFPRGADLSQPWNEHMSMGEALSRSADDIGLTIAAGCEVQ